MSHQFHSVTVPMLNSVTAVHSYAHVCVGFRFFLCAIVYLFAFIFGLSDAQ